MNSQSNPTPRRIVVTGSNKGLGYEIITKLLASATPYEIILTARNPALGEKALETLRSNNPKSLSKVIYHQLDVNDEKSISEFLDWIKTIFGKIDVLVNNAAVAYTNPSDEEKKFTIQTNFFSVVNLSEKILPLLSDDGKILIMSSGLGELDNQSEALRKALEDPKLDRAGLLQVADNFLDLTKGFKSAFFTGEPSYPGSKALVNAYVRYILPNEVGANQQVYAICPGWCKTDMGTDAAPLPAEAGADTPVYLIELPFKRDPEINGKFIHERKVRGW